MISVTLPLKTVTECNTLGHWRVKSKRAKEQRWIAHASLRSHTLRLPCVVTITRIAAGTLDAHDNLPSALKHVVDGIADALGVADNDARVTWRYAQEKRTRSRATAHLPPYEVRFTIEESP